MSVWRLALSMLRGSVRRLSCRTPEAVEFPQVQFSDKASIGLCAIPGVNIETSWVMSVAFAVVESQCSWAVV